MIIIFCGIPGTGKTTVAELLAKELRKTRLDSRGEPTRGGRGKVKIFTSDKISGSFYKKIPQILKENLGKADFLILDATFYKKQWRDLVQKLAKGQKIFTIYLYASVDTCVDRNKKRKGAIPERAVHIMHHQMEEPRDPDISINTEMIRPEKVLKLCLNQLF